MRLSFLIDPPSIPFLVLDAPLLGARLSPLAACRSIMLPVSLGEFLREDPVWVVDLELGGRDDPL